MKKILVTVQLDKYTNVRTEPKTNYDMDINLTLDEDFHDFVLIEDKDGENMFYVTLDSLTAAVETLRKARYI